MTRYRARIVAAVLVASSLCCRPAFAVFLHGFQLLSYCESADPVERGVCYGFVQGVGDALNDGREVCLPHVSAGELRLVVIKSLHEKPETLHESAVSLIYRMLRLTYPCAK